MLGNCVLVLGININTVKRFPSEIIKDSFKLIEMSDVAFFTLDM